MYCPVNYVLPRGKIRRKVEKAMLFPQKVRFFAEVLKKFPKLPYFVVAKELYNQEQKGGGH
jgi:hypothetical protein